MRAFQAVGGTPRFIARGEGARVWDVDGRAYIDFVGSWGPLILGHAIRRSSRAIAAGRLRLAFGAPTEREVELAERFARLMPSMESVRLVKLGHRGDDERPCGWRAAAPGAT